MKNLNNNRYTILASLATLVIYSATQAQVFELRTDRNPSVALIDDVEDGLGVTISPNDKWIGIMCRPVDGSLRAHISLPDDAGLLVEEVIPDSPAEQAGLQKYDILLSANGAPLANIGDLIRSIGKSGDGPLTLEWVRSGNVTETEVTPTDRPNRPELAFDADQFGPKVHNLRAWIDDLENKGFQGQQPLRLRVFGEGFDVQDEEYPSNLSVQVQKSGNDLAQITVRRGDSSWEVTEDRIDELPEDIQPFVQRLLGGRGGGQMMDFHFDGHMNGQLPYLHLDQSIQEMHQRMDEMFEQLRELREEEPADDEDTIDA